MRLRTLLPLAVLALAGCADHRDITAVSGRPGGAMRTITPTGTLDQNIATLLALFPNGLANAGQARWTSVKAKYADGLNKPQQMAVAKKMLFELSQWVQDKAPQMSTPPNDETTTAAAARLTLYMSMYVFNGPTTPPPVYLPAADNAVGLVTPDAPATVVTPTEQAGVSLQDGAVDESTIIVITENPTPYPDNCAGPLATKLCQYPKFYTFNQFPHKRLQKAAKFAVCHVNAGDNRHPLADHDRFRLAHTKPADPADYTPGSTIRDQNGESIEILPLITQTFSVCDDVEYALSDPPSGVTGALLGIAHSVSKLLTPKSAYAIDQGGGGLSLDFSDFNDIDPMGTSDNDVGAVTLSTSVSHTADHITFGYSLSNIGTATAASVPATIRFSTSPTITTADTILETISIPSLVPGGTSSAAGIPLTVPNRPNGTYYIGLLVDDDATFPDANLANNTASAALTIDADFISAPQRMEVGENTVCTLTAANATYCWGSNSFGQFGAAGPTSTSPFQPTPLQLGFTALAFGKSQSVCGVKADHSAVCWGRDGFGQLGRGAVVGWPLPPATVVGGINWSRVTVSRLSACGVSTTGAGYCWGSNQRGEVGVASVPMQSEGPPPPPMLSTVSTSPRLLDGGLTWKSVVAGWIHACGITTSGDAYCWGDNVRGQLGIGAPDTAGIHRSPAPVVGGLHFLQLSLGATYTCGITTDHKAYCWGENYTGQLGDGTTTRRGSPTLVAGGHRFAYIAAGSGFGDNFTPLPLGPPAPPQGGFAHTCALTETGAAYCWGWNAFGQLGEGSTTDQLLPTAVAGSLTFTSLGAGAASTCGQLGESVWCWGSNIAGQIGNGTLINTATPVLSFAPVVIP